MVTLGEKIRNKKIVTKLGVAPTEEKMKKTVNDSLIMYDVSKQRHYFDM